MLDTRTHAWSVPESDGALPKGRSGHAGALMDGCWYISGGGDNTQALTETLVLEVPTPGGAEAA